MSAQSWASVPPVPAWISRTASPASYWPSKSASSCSRPSSPSSEATSFAISVLVLAEREQLLRVLELALKPLVALELADEPRVLGGDASRTGLVVPEPGSPHRLLELDASRR